MMEMGRHASAVDFFFTFVVLMFHTGFMRSLLAYRYRGNQEAVAFSSLLISLLAQGIAYGLGLLHLAAFGSGY